jgi:hypothetical protein
MRCKECGGAQIVLTKVVRDDAMAVLGFERHTFRCLECHETDRRLVFIKQGRETDAEPLPVHPSPPVVPATSVQHGRSGRSRSVEARACKDTRSIGS